MRASAAGAENLSESKCSPGLCCKNYLWTSASEMAALSPDASRRLKWKVELFTDESDGLGEGTGAEAEGAFDDARLAADVLG